MSKTSNSLAAAQEPKWYTSISELPFRKFVDVVVDNNLMALTKAGFPDINDLKHAWQFIISEYSDAIADAHNKLYFQLKRDLTIMAITKSQVENLVKLLSVFKYKKLEAELNNLLNTKFTFSDDTREKDLKRCLAMLKGHEIKMEIKEQNLRALDKNHEDTFKKPDREYFQGVLITLSDHAKYPITDGITTYEYCERLKRFIAYCETSKKIKK